MSEPLRIDRRRADVAAENAERERRYTDLANAERFARCNPDTAYVKPWGCWLVYDGRRYVRDDRDQIRLRATSVVRSILLEASEARPPDTPLAKHALHSMSDKAIRAMLSLAQCEGTIAAVPGDFDADPWLLNCANGTLDLRSGELREASQDDGITKLCPAPYDPDARFDPWDRFLERVVPDPEVRGFLQRAAGYSLTGDTREEVLFFLHGAGANGKSTFVEALKAALGDYAAVADFETFVKRPVTGGPRNDVAALAGARLVVSIEVDEGRHLAEGLVKLLTGGDTITARKLYAEGFEFRPQLKLWLVANAAPRVRDDDQALWRRIVRIPFDVEIPEAERDPDVKALLRSPQAGPAVLAWAVRGCAAWQRDRLKPPETVRQATADYRADMDPLRDFLEERCELDPEGWVASAELRQAYERHCEANGERPLKGKAFAARLLARGLTRAKRGHESVRAWSGLFLRGQA